MKYKGKYEFGGYNNDWQGAIMSNGVYKESYLGLIIPLIIIIPIMTFMYIYMEEMFYLFTPIWIMSFFVGLLLPTSSNKSV